MCKIKICLLCGRGYGRARRPGHASSGRGAGSDGRKFRTVDFRGKGALSTLEVHLTILAILASLAILAILATLEVHLAILACLQSTY